MTKKQTGGRAYPTMTWECNIDGKVAHYQEEGMTLRDYFAAKAMQAAIARGNDTNRPGIAEWAYCMADAMLKAREA